MNYFETVFEISREIYANSKFVKIDFDKIRNECKDWTPKRITEKIEFTHKEKRKIVLLELVLNAINYCYWYGSWSYRYDDCGSHKMMMLVEESFKDYKFEDERECNICHQPEGETFSECIDLLKSKIIQHRFPLLEERLKHLEELIPEAPYFCDMLAYFIEEKLKDIYDFNYIVTTMFENFPGYCSDLFLKRASLFFISLHRQFGFFEKQINLFPVPADYQVPKVLNHHGFLNYHDDLQKLINSEQLIPKTSRMEVEIRAATILACDEICKISKLKISDVDEILWQQRKEISIPFHMTVTTDY